MQMLVMTLVMLAALLLANEIFRRSGIITILVFIILPVVLLPWWGTHYDFSWFLWAKIYSITLGISLLSACRQTSISHSRWIYILIWITFLINIAEATVYDALATNHLQWINVATGVILICTMPGPGAIKVDTASPYRDLSWDISYSWIILYTIWNWLFVYGNWPGIGSLQHLAVLGAPLLISFFRRQQWAQARAYTLGTYFIVWFTFNPIIKTPEIASWYNSNVYIVIASATLCYGIILLVGTVKNRFLVGQSQTFEK